jgi:predicted RNA binding protein YcfA (HicA-like mRNA interferase family)
MRNPETSRMAVVPSGTPTLQTGLVRAIIRKAGLSPEEFRRLLD